MSLATFLVSIKVFIYLFNQNLLIWFGLTFSHHPRMSVQCCSMLFLCYSMSLVIFVTLFSIILLSLTFSQHPCHPLMFLWCLEFFYVAQCPSNVYQEILLFLDVHLGTSKIFFKSLNIFSTLSSTPWSYIISSMLFDISIIPLSFHFIFLCTFFSQHYLSLSISQSLPHVIYQV